MTIKVIILDDDKDTLRHTSKYLLKEDPTLNLHLVASSEEALQLLEKADYDVIVSENKLSEGMDGLELLNRIRSQNNIIPFILFTRNGGEDVAAAALNYGANYYITKSAEMQTMYANLAHVIRKVVSQDRIKGTLNENDSRLRAAFEDAAIGMAIVSLDQVILQVNTALCEILGYPASQLRGRNLEEIAHPDEIGKIPLKALQVLKEGNPESLSGERKFLHADGKWVWTQTTISLTKDSNEKPLYFVMQFQDITEAKIATIALRDSEQRFRGAFEDAAIGMALVNIQDGSIHINNALQRMLGYTNEELNEISFTGITHPDDVDKTPRIDDGMFSGGRSSVQLEKRYLRKDGQVVYTFISSSIVYDHENQPMYYVTQFQDITEQKRASHALEVSESNYKYLLETSLQNYAVIQDGRYIYVNKAFAETIGMPREELLRLNPEEIWNLVHPEDRELLQKRNQDIKKGIREIPKIEFRYVRPDGQIRWVEGMIRRFEYNERPAIQGVEIDITEKKAFDEALQNSLDFLDTLLNTIPNPVFFKDKSDIYQQCNPAFANQIMGLPVDDVKGKTSEHMIGRVKNLSKAELIALDEELIENGDEQSFEIQIDAPNRGLRTYLVNRTLYHDNDGNQLGIVGVMQDITALRMLQNDLTSQKEELSEFAQVMSHDLKGMLHNAMLYAEMLENQYEKKNVEGIRCALQTAQQILQRSLLLADAGLVIGGTEEVDLNKLIDIIILQELNGQAEFERDDLPKVTCDRLKVTQVFSNILRNALEHGKPKKIEIRVNTTSDFHEISIMNDGKKIPKESKQTIFDTPLKPMNERGLGLRIVKKIIQAHGWTITLAESKKTTFVIRVPIDRRNI